jgi:putative sterol carrier protein
MARFLSSAWVEELDAAVRDDDRVRRATAGTRLVVGQVVTGTPEGDVRYAIHVDDGTVRVREGDLDAADVTFTQDHPTALAIASGQLPAQQAFMEGRLRVSGDLALLMAHADTLAELDEALGRPRPSTTFATP